VEINISILLKNKTKGRISVGYPHPCQGFNFQYFHHHSNTYQNVPLLKSPDELKQLRQQLPAMAIS
jgi:hypothetical protein